MSDDKVTNIHEFKKRKKEETATDEFQELYDRFDPVIPTREDYKSFARVLAHMAHMSVSQTVKLEVQPETLIIQLSHVMDNFDALDPDSDLDEDSDEFELDMGPDIQLVMTKALDLYAPWDEICLPDECFDESAESAGFFADDIEEGLQSITIEHTPDPDTEEDDET